MPTHALRIDYLRITADVSPTQLIAWGENVTADFAHLPARGLYGYARSHRWESHPTVVAWTDDDLQQRPMLELTGESCTRAHDVGSDLRAHVLEWQKAVDLHCTRIDIALDIFDCNIDLKRLADRYNKRSLEREFFGDSKGGQTEYIGARSSERRLYLYNKQAQKKTPYKWVRLEFRLVESRAKHAFARVMEGKSLEGVWLGLWGNHMGGLEVMKRYLQSEENPVEVKGRARAETDTERWLMEVVTKALARACKENPQLYGTFIAELDARGRAIGAVKEGFDIG